MEAPEVAARVAVHLWREPGADLMVVAEARRVLCPEWLPGLPGAPVAAEASLRKKNSWAFSGR